MPVSEFNGGKQTTNRFFENLGFEILTKDDRSEEISGNNMIYELKNELIVKQEQIDKDYNELKDSGLIEFVTFHPSYSYDEFIEGITIREDIEGEEVKNPYTRKDGIFKMFCTRALRAALEGRISGKEKNWKELFDSYRKIEPGERKKIWEEAENNPNMKYVLIIDEINRGDISKIFGELVTLLEADKRLGGKNELVARLPLSNDYFSVPPNIYIIGTMNTADRSIALIDIALRRRFGFKEMVPDFDKLKDDFNDLPDDCILAKSIRKLEKINTEIREKENLGKEKEIGHSFFYSMHGKGDEDVLMVWINEIFPLLEEYFFGEYDKLEEICKDVYDPKLKRFKVDYLEGWLNEPWNSN